MPNVSVVSKTPLVATAKLVEPKTTEIQTITQTEVELAVQAVAEAQEAGKIQRAAEKKRDAALMVVFQKMLGVKTLDEVKALDIPAMNKLLQERKDAFKLEANFKLQHGGERVSPAWKEAFIAKLGEAEAANVVNATPASHTWHIVNE